MLRLPTQLSMGKGALGGKVILLQRKFPFYSRGQRGSSPLPEQHWKYVEFLFPDTAFSRLQVRSLPDHSESLTLLVSL